MMRTTLLAGLLGLAGLSLASPIEFAARAVPSATCGDALYQCFTRSSAVASAYCSGLPTNYMASPPKISGAPACIKCFTKTPDFTSACSCIGFTYTGMPTMTGWNTTTATPTMTGWNTTTATAAPTGYNTTMTGWNTTTTAAAAYPNGFNSTSMMATSTGWNTTATMTGSSTSTATDTITGYSVAAAATTTTTGTSTTETSTSTSSSSTSTDATSTVATTTTTAASTTTTTASAVVTDAAYKDTVLRHHNAHRANHSSPALEWDDQLAAYAATRAASCYFEHISSNPYGENLAAGIPATQMGVSITDLWYNSEMDAYKLYGSEPPSPDPNSSKYGHFTQLVWKASKRVGCYTYDCTAKGGLTEKGPSGSPVPLDPSIPAFLTACVYDPKGNFQDFGPGNTTVDGYAKNVLSPGGADVITASFGCSGKSNCADP